MSNKPWKQEERQVARLVRGRRYPANQGGRVDVESPSIVAQVKQRPAVLPGAVGGPGGRDSKARGHAGQGGHGGGEAACGARDGDTPAGGDD